MKTPYFTIIVPTHRRAALLRRSLGSLRSNDFKDFQIILVADETDAATMQVAAELLGDDDLFIKRSGPKGRPADHGRDGYWQHHLCCSHCCRY